MNVVTDDGSTTRVKQVRHIRYHKIFGPDKQTAIVKMRYLLCDKHAGKFCIICAAESGRLPLWLVIKNKICSCLWGR